MQRQKPEDTNHGIFSGEITKYSDLQNYCAANLVIFFEKNTRFFGSFRVITSANFFS